MGMEKDFQICKSIPGPHLLFEISDNEIDLSGAESFEWLMQSCTQINPQRETVEQFQGSNDSAAVSPACRPLQMPKTPGIFKPLGKQVIFTV